MASWFRAARVATFVTLLAPSLRAQPVKAVVAHAPAGAGQLELDVGFDAGGRLVAATCRTPACGLAGGQEIPLPADARALASHAQLSPMSIGAGHHAIVVTIPDVAQARSWRAVVAAPLSGGAPDVLFAGWTGFIEGEEGLRHGPMVIVPDPEPDGTRRIVVGEQRQDLQLCGRPAVLSPQLLLGSDVKLHPAKVQRLTPEQRASAVALTAHPLGDGETRTSYPLLHAVAATSAVGEPGALTDGNPETTWSENRGGSGRGEFVLMNAPPQLPITGFLLTVRPKQAAVAHGTAPRDFYLATNKQLFKVSMPDDAWQHAGARYEIALPAPLHTDCLALVTDSAYDESKDARTTVAELGAETDFDASKLDALVSALAGGDAHAVAAGSVLVALGDPAFAAVSKAYDTLDEGGRRVALDVIDHAPCKASVPVYLRALLGPYRAHRLHARDRIPRCGDEAADAIVPALPRAAPRARPILAAELAIVAPKRAVDAIVPMLNAPDGELRRLLRIELGHAAEAPAARDAVRQKLASADLSERARLDTLRALGARLPEFLPEAGQAFARLATPGASFRTRFLLLEPAAALAARSPAAAAFLGHALTADPDEHVRAQAARVVSVPAAFKAALLHAVDDPGVRVREAAAETLGERGGTFAAAALAGRLGSDRWPLVRAAAANALAGFGPDPAVDRALGAALADDSISVRAPVIEALGRRRAVAYAPALRERVEDKKEALEVRVAAASALGRMCDAGSIDLLTRYAQKLADPFSDADVRAIGPAAVAALGRLHPPDLKQRLAPLMTPKAPVGARFAVHGALSGPGSCSRPR